MADFIFWIIVGLTIGSAILVVQSKKLVYSAYALLFTLFGVTGLYVFLWADFLAVVQVVVYIGGILVLIIFGIMLTNKITSVNISNTEWPVCIYFNTSPPIINGIKPYISDCNCTYKIKSNNIGISLNSPK